MRTRRTRLYIPGNNPHYIEAAGLYGADVIVLDLEDSVPLDQKFDARILVKYALQNVDFGGSEKWVRINSLNTKFWENDIKEIIRYCDIINIPKIQSDSDINKVIKYIEKLEKAYNISEKKIVPIIESFKGLINIKKIINNSKVVAVIWGAEDLTAELGISREDALILDYIRAYIVMVAKAYKKQALDTVYSNIEDQDGLYKYARKARNMGFDGIGIIHPNQIEIVHKAFKPSKEEIDYARKVLREFELAKKEGKGVIVVDGKMVDKPVVEKAWKILKLAEET